MLCTYSILNASWTLTSPTLGGHGVPTARSETDPVADRPVETWDEVCARDPASITAVRMWRATNELVRRIEAAVRPHGVTHTQLVVLLCVGHLGRRDGGRSSRVRMTDVVDLADLDPNLVSQVLRRLEASGLVQRRPDPVDGRARLLALTTAGEASVEEATPAMDAVHADFFAALSSDEHGRLHRMLGHLVRDRP